MRKKERKNAYTSSFDDYLRGHIKTSNKTFNIRGIFRVPDIPGGERLMIDAEEKENEEKEETQHGEQKLQVPLRNIEDENLNLPSQPNEALEPLKRNVLLNIG